MQDQNLYKQIIIDHYKNPRNYGEMEDSSMKAHVNNTVCGDELTVYLKMEDNKIAAVKYKGSGCAISVAGMSLLSEQLIGKTIEEVRDLGEDYVLGLLGLDKKTPRKKCALLGLKALESAINMEEDEPCDFC